VSHNFPKWVQRAGLEDIHLHDLRHAFASRLAMAGEQLLTIKELMGCRRSSGWAQI
jgi:site-specific recombinase XerD